MPFRPNFYHFHAVFDKNIAKLKIGISSFSFDAETDSIGSSGWVGGGGARNMKSIWPPFAAIFFMTYFEKQGLVGHVPLGTPSGSATVRSDFPLEYTVLQAQDICCVIVTFIIKISLEINRNYKMCKHGLAYIGIADTYMDPLLFTVCNVVVAR